MKIEDNFLVQEKFDELQALIMNRKYTGNKPPLSWTYNEGIDYEKEDKNRFQFTHMFYFNGISTSPYMEKLAPILKIITPISLWRIKANLLTRTPEIVENAFHTDITQSEEKLKQFTTSIFYINTNNGYTKFEDGTKVESVANRLVTFPANMKHKGTSCTDEKRRIVINFNYFSVI